MNSRPLPYQGSALPLSYTGVVGAEDEVRTRDPQLGRLMLYRLSYFRNFLLQGDSLSKEKPDQSVGLSWEKMDSNHRRYKPADLQSAPFGHSGILPKFLRTFEPMEGIEPTTPRLQITCSGQLSYIGNIVSRSRAVAFLRDCKGRHIF